MAENPHPHEPTAGRADVQPRPRPAPTGARRVSFLRGLAEQALAEGRPVLIVPREISDSADASPLTVDEEQLPEGVIVVFVGAEGFACATGARPGAEIAGPQAPATEAPPGPLAGALPANGRTKMVTGGLPAEDAKSPTSLPAWEIEDLRSPGEAS